MRQGRIRRGAGRGAGAVLSLALLAGASPGAPWFVALEVPSATRRVLAGVQARLGEAVPDLAPTEPPGFHLTLAFLGELPEASRPRTRRLLRAAAASHRPFWLRYCGLGAFPFRGSPHPRVLWAGTRGDQAALEDLAASLRAVATRVTGRSSRYPFRPHVTLGRLPAAAARPGWERWRERLAGVGFGIHRVDAAWLLEGGAGPTGYPRVERLPLGGAGAGEEWRIPARGDTMGASLGSSGMASTP